MVEGVPSFLTEANRWWCNDGAWLVPSGGDAGAPVPWQLGGGGVVVVRWCFLLVLLLVRLVRLVVRFGGGAVGEGAWRDGEQGGGAMGVEQVNAALDCSGRALRRWWLQAVYRYTSIAFISYQF